MPLTDIFNQNAFNSLSLTTAINTLPRKPGRIGSMGLFSPQGINTTTLVVEFRDNVLTLLPTKARGAEPSLADKSKRTVRSFAVPHIPYDDQIDADSVQNVRAFGSENQMQTVSQVVNDQLALMRQHHEVTWEHLMVGALKGKILDADGQTELFNLFTEFGVTETEVDFVLGTGTTDIKAKCLEVKRAIETALGAGIAFTGVHALCSKTFFDALTSHTLVKTAYERWQDGAFLREDNRTGFPYGGIFFEEYNYSVTNKAGSSIPYIVEGDARFFATGAPNLFKMHYAPANFIETVNTIGRPLYAKQKVMDMEVGIHIHTQSNPLPLCHVPASLIRGHSSN